MSAAAVHAPKVSHHDLRENTHRVNKGTFAVDLYELGGGWLYMARPFKGHPHIAYMEAYLLPNLGLQVNRWGHHPGSAYAWYDFYVDVMAFEVGEDGWTTRDLYLDVVVIEGRAAQIADTDEYLAASGAGLMTAAEASYALTHTHALLNGLGECGYSLRTWLRRAAGLEVTF